VLEIHERPVTRDELIGELARRADGEVPEAPIDQLVDLLVADGILVDAAPATTAGPRPARGARVVLGISGAIAAIDAPALIRGLHAIGCDVRVALTKTATRFVAVDAIAALTHHAVWHDIWQGDAAVPVPHVNLAEWADLVVVYPASATTLARIATGDCSDLVSAIVAATRAPVVIAPSMNDAMYGSPAVQANLATLRDHGRWLVHPALGIEVAHPPADRRSMLGPAPPPAAVLDVIRHLLASIATTARAVLPADAAGWERLWSSTPFDRLPWHVDAVDAPLAAALDARRDPPGRRLVDIGTGAGTVAIDAARRGFAVTATDVSPSALGKARERAGDLPILFVLDDVTAPRLDGAFDVAVDCGLLHCLPRDRWPDYARALTGLVAPGGSLLVVAHQPGAELATTPVTGDDLRALLPAFVIAGTRPTTLSRADATLFDLERRMDA
jgi:SAM-dependent methyltransferase